MFKIITTRNERSIKKRFIYFQYFLFCLIGTIQDTDVTTPKQRRKKMQFVYTQIHWCRKMSNSKKDMKKHKDKYVFIYIYKYVYVYKEKSGMTRSRLNRYFICFVYCNTEKNKRFALLLIG